MPESPRHDIIGTAEQAASDEHRVQQRLFNAERVERDDRDAAGDRLDRCRRADRDQPLGTRQRESHRLVREDEVRRPVRKQLSVGVALEVRLGLTRARAQLHHDPTVRARGGGPAQDADQLLALVPLSGHQCLRGEDQIGATALALGHRDGAAGCIVRSTA